MSNKWKKSWKSSKQPSKQKKYRENAPYHHRNKFLSAKLSDDLKDKIGTGTLPVRKGDKAEIMRGDYEGLSGTVDQIDYTDYKIYINGINRERVDGTETKVAIDPSNVKLIKLELEDHKRVEKYELTEEEKEEIKSKEVQEESEEEQDKEQESEDTTEEKEEVKEQNKEKDSEDTTKEDEEQDEEGDK